MTIKYEILKKQNYKETYKQFELKEKTKIIRNFIKIKMD